MGLNNSRVALNKHRGQLRRKRLSKLHKQEDLRMSRGDYTPVSDRFKRRLHNRRDHHRKMVGKNKRNYNRKPEE